MINRQLNRETAVSASSVQAVFPNGRPILTAQNLHKSYDGVPALRGLSFSLQAGRIMGFLGPNGAGKTTAIRILTTIFEASDGNFFVDGTSSQHPAKIRQKIWV
jgi:ABC-2 type transport system ATP-binding protein